MSQLKLIRYIFDNNEKEELLHYAAYVYCRQHHRESITIYGFNKEPFQQARHISLNQCEQKIHRRIINLNFIYDIFSTWHYIWFGAKQHPIRLYQITFSAPLAKQETLYVLPESLMEILGVEVFHQFSTPFGQEQDYAFGNTRITVAAPATPQWAAAPKNATVSDDDMPF